MELFDLEIDATANLLPNDGVVNYFGKVLQQNEADQYLNAFQNEIEWHQDEVIMFGKKITTKRKVAWYGERAFEYTYSKTTKRALPWTKELVELKAIIEKRTGENFNSCLLNLYHDGSEGMGWHSDDEKELKKHGAIASMSFGADRKFSFKHKVTREKVDLILHHGSLLVMKDATQTHWLHRLPPTKRVMRPRVNITFRTISDPENSCQML